MSTPTTTPATIRAAMVPLIEAITPTHTERQDVLWNHVGDVDPRGSDIRAFRILTDIASFDEGGSFGGNGMEASCELRVRVAYGGIDGNEATDLITRDGLDLWRVFHPSPGGLAQTIAGLIRFEGMLEPEVVSDSDEDSYLVVDFVTRCHFKAAY